MAISTQTQNLNLIPGKSAPVVVHLSQGNVGNTVQFYLYNGADPYIPSNVSIAVHGVRADGSVFGPYTVTTTTGSNLVSFSVVSAMTSVNGAAIGELVLTDSNQNQIGTANFGMLVEKTPYSSSVTYEDDLSIYQRILAYVQSNDAATNSRINFLQTEIDQIVAPTGEAPSAAEVQNARIAGNGTTYNTLGNAIRSQTDTLKYLYFVNHVNKQPFEVSVTASGSSYSYTITAKIKDGSVYYGFDSISHTTYSLRYASGCNNVGTSNKDFRFDDTITSAGFGGFVLFVADTSDKTLKIIHRNAYVQTQFVIAVFFGTTPVELNKNLLGFGTNADLFRNQKTTNALKKFYIASYNTGAYNALTFGKDSDGYYKITKNHEFTVYGFAESSNSDSLTINSSSGDYSFPQELRSFEPITSYALFMIAINPSITNSDKKFIIVPIKDISFWRTNYAVIGVLYDKNAGMFFSRGAEALFTNTIQYHMNNEDMYAGTIASYWKRLHDTAFPLRGTIVYEPDLHRITFTSVLLAPSQIPGKWNSTQTTVVDWSDQPNPDDAKAIYYDYINARYVCYGSVFDPNDSSDTELDRAYKKVGMALICVVWQSKYYYMCGAPVSGIWFVNNHDVYASSSGSGSDLYKAFKKVGVVGDSLSVGYMYNKSTGTATARMLAYSWPKVVMRDSGSPWLNLGTSGQNVLTWYSNDTYGKVQAEASGNKCQAYIIGLGENDQSNSTRGIPLGSSSDINSDYTVAATTYYGGYARIIQFLKHINPTCKIFCVTNPRTGGNARAAYNEAIRYIVNTYYADDDDVILIDEANSDASLFNGSGFLPSDAEAIEGGHYSPSGYVRIASIMERLLSEAMEAKVSSMHNIAYIPYDTGDPTPNTTTV